MFLEKNYDTRQSEKLNVNCYNVNLNSETLRDVLMDAATFMWKAGKQKAAEITINVVDNEEVDRLGLVMFFTLRVC
jgi:hypothetical protein